MANKELNFNHLLKSIFKGKRLLASTQNLPFPETRSMMHRSIGMRIALAHCRVTLSPSLWRRLQDKSFREGIGFL
jgi:hypothetical protein